jgi:hypothetical protein
MPSEQMPPNDQPPAPDAGPAGQSARTTERHQHPVTDDLAVMGNLGDRWTVPVPDEMPPPPPHVDPNEGAFALLSAVRFAPVAEIQLSPGGRREVELQVAGSSVLLGTVRWIGTNSRLDTVLSLDGSSLATGSRHGSLDRRGGSVLGARTTGGGLAVLAVTNTSEVTVQAKIVLGALDAAREGGEPNV